MPIEIKELHIKVTVNQDATNGENFYDSRTNALDSRKLVKECVEQVLETLKQKDLR